MPAIVPGARNRRKPHNPPWCARCNSYGMVLRKLTGWMDYIRCPECLGRSVPEEEVEYVRHGSSEQHRRR